MSVERDELFHRRKRVSSARHFSIPDRLGRSGKERRPLKVVLNVNDNQKLFHFLCSFYIFPFSCFFLFISNSLSLSSKNAKLRFDIRLSSEDHIVRQRCYRHKQIRSYFIKFATGDFPRIFSHNIHIVPRAVRARARRLRNNATKRIRWQKNFHGKACHFVTPPRTVFSAAERDLQYLSAPNR